MGYERDPDTRTKGVGAIAASDMASRRVRQARRVAVGRATRRRDQLMSNIAKKASMGYLGLGYTPTLSQDGGGGGSSKGGKGAGGITATFVGASGATTSGTKLGTAQPGGGTVMTFNPQTTGVTATFNPPPTSTIVIDPAPGTTGVGVTGGSSGSAGGAGITLEPPPSVTINPIPMPPDDPEISGDGIFTPRNLMIAGAAGLAAYLLFFRKRSAP